MANEWFGLKPEQLKAKIQPQQTRIEGEPIFIIPKGKIPSLVSDYVSEMETQRTNEWCKCEWIIHPDDEHIDPHNCVNCGHPRMLHNDVPPIADEDVLSPCSAQQYDDPNVRDCDCSNWVSPPKRRMRKGTQHPQCPVHTKEGFILGFFEWVFSNDH